MIVGSALLYDHSAIDRPATILRVAQQLRKKYPRCGIKRIQITKTLYLIPNYLMADKITPKDVSEKKDDFVLIDVREADEVAEEGTIEGAVNIPLGQLIRKGRQGGLDDLKGKTICTYCNGGYRGNIRAYELNKKGLEV